MGRYNDGRSVKRSEPYLSVGELAMLGRTLGEHLRDMLGLTLLGLIAWAASNHFALAADEPAKHVTVAALIHLNATPPAALDKPKYDAAEFAVYKKTQALLILT